MTNERNIQRISFVIPVLNAERDLGQCLDSITSEMAAQDEIILVDNGSSDRTLEIARLYDKVTILEHPECTIAGLRNRGAEKAAGDMYAFIDADCVLCPGWRCAVTSVLSRDDVHATGSISVLPENPSWVEKVWLSERKRTERKVNYIPSANFIAKRDIFEAVDGFDEQLVTDEDTDIGARLNAEGYTILDSPEVRVIHLGNAKTLMQFARRQKWHATSVLDTFRWNKIDKPLLMTLVFIVTTILGIIAMPVFDQFGLSPLWGLVLIGMAPVLTAIYRSLQYRNFKYFVHLVVLYCTFYVVRVLALIEQIAKRLIGKSRHVAVHRP